MFQKQWHTDDTMQFAAEKNKSRLTPTARMISGGVLGAVLALAALKVFKRRRQLAGVHGSPRFFEKDTDADADADAEDVKEKDAEEEDHDEAGLNDMDEVQQRAALVNKIRESINAIKKMFAKVNGLNLREDSHRFSLQINELNGKIVETCEICIAMQVWFVCVSMQKQQARKILQPFIAYVDKPGRYMSDRAYGIATRLDGNVLEATGINVDFAYSVRSFHRIFTSISMIDTSEYALMFQDFLNVDEAPEASRSDIYKSLDRDYANVMFEIGEL